MNKLIWFEVEERDYGIAVFATDGERRVRVGGFLSVEDFNQYLTEQLKITME